MKISTSKPTSKTSASRTYILMNMQPRNSSKQVVPAVVMPRCASASDTGQNHVTCCETESTVHVPHDDAPHMTVNRSTVHWTEFRTTQNEPREQRSIKSYISPPLLAQLFTAVCKVFQTLHSSLCFAVYVFSGLYFRIVFRAYSLCNCYSKYVQSVVVWTERIELKPNRISVYFVTGENTAEFVSRPLIYRVGQINRTVFRSL